MVKNLPASAGDARDAGSIRGSGRFPGEGNDNPLQFSCLENSMDRGACQATVHRVAKSQTQLSDWAHMCVGFRLHAMLLESSYRSLSIGKSLRQNLILFCWVLFYKAVILIQGWEGCITWGFFQMTQPSSWWASMIAFSASSPSLTQRDTVIVYSVHQVCYYRKMDWAMQGCVIVGFPFERALLTWM